MCVNQTIAVPSEETQMHAMDVTSAILDCVRNITDNLESLMLLRDALVNEPNEKTIVQMDVVQASPMEAAAALLHCVNSVSHSLHDLLNVKAHHATEPTTSEPIDMLAKTVPTMTEPVVQNTQAVNNPIEQGKQQRNTSAKAIVTEISNIEKSLDNLMHVRDTLWHERNNAYFTAMDPVEMKENEVADSIFMYVNKVAQSSSVLLEIQVGLTPNAQGVIEYQDTGLRLVAEMIARSDERKKAIAALP